MLAVVAAGLLAAAATGCQDRAATTPGEPAPGPEAVETRLAVARAAIESGDLRDGIARTWAITEADPGHLEAHLLLASAYTLAARHADALRAADDAIEIDGAAAGAWITRGAALLGLGRLDEAVTASQRALDLAPNNPAALSNLARVHGKRGDLKAQEAPLRALVAADPDDLGARMELARNRASTGAWREAVTVAEQAVERAPTDPRLHLFLAAAHLELDEHGAAMDRADLAARLDPEAEEATRVFEAAFFLAVSRALICAHGPGPWEVAQIEAALAPFRDQGVSGASVFHDLQARFSGDEGVQARVQRAAASCPTRAEGL